MLVPAGVLVLVILGAIVIDSAVVFLAHRELNNRAAAAANDAAVLALDEASYYGGGAVCLDSGAAEAVVQRAFASGQVPSAVRSVDTRVTIEGRHVTVGVVGEVPLVFAPAIPGTARVAHVSTQASAAARGASGSLSPDSCF